MIGWDFALETYKELLEDAIRDREGANLRIKKYKAMVKRTEAQKGEEDKQHSEAER